MLPKILLVSNSETSFKELFRVAKLLKQSSKFEPVFHLSGQVHSLMRMRLACRENNIMIVNGEMEQQQNNSHPFLRDFVKLCLLKIGKTMTKILPAWFYESIIQLPHFIVLFLLNLNSIRLNRSLLHSVEPVIVVVPEDGVGGDLSLIKLARKQQLPVVVVPYEYSTKKQIIEALQSNSTYRTKYGMVNILNRVVARFFPNWAYTYQGERMLRDTVSTIFALEILGLAPRDPWTVHGGYSDFLLVESEKMYEHYIKEGLPVEKLVFTGALSSDDLFQTLSRKTELKNRLCMSFGFRNDAKLILSSIPTDYTTRKQSEFQSYKDLIDFWMKSLQELENVNLLLQLHPAVTPDQAEYIRKSGIPVTSENIATLIPLCDVLITSVSSIIRMAISCGIPVINYDMYRFRYMDYETEKGVITIYTRKDFESALASIFLDEEYSQEIREYQAGASTSWGILDGKVGDRMIEMFNGLCYGKQ